MENKQPRRITPLGSLLDAPVYAVATAEAPCPVCGEAVIQQKCKIVCRSERCVYRIIYNCSEF